MKVSEAWDLLTQLKTIIAADNSWSQEAKDIMGKALDTAIQALKQNDHIKEKCYFYDMDKKSCTYHGNSEWIEKEPCDYENCNNFIDKDALGRILIRVFKEYVIDDLTKNEK